MWKIRYSSHFLRTLEKLPISLRMEAKKRESIFRVNPFDSRLKTHKLKGKNRELRSFSVTYKHRIVFKFLDNNMIDFITVGDHSIYK